MVLWELTAITAYFLGLKRTYRLALHVQRRLIPPNHPRIRDFVFRRTRDVFNVAVSVHKKIQERDIEVGRNLGNAILRWLDRMKPSAEIRPRLPPPNGSLEQYKHVSRASRSAGAQKTSSKASPPRFQWKDAVLAPQHSAQVLSHPAHDDAAQQNQREQPVHVSSLKNFSRGNLCLIQFPL